jgi:hypothetical protein
MWKSVDVDSSKPVLFKDYIEVGLAFLVLSLSLSVANVMFYTWMHMKLKFGKTNYI